MRPLFLKSFSHIDRSLQVAAQRLRNRAESLSLEVSNAQRSLRSIQEAFVSLQEEGVAATAAILLCENKLREAITDTERFIREGLSPTTPTVYFLRTSPSELLRNPSGKARLAGVRSFMTLLENAPSSLGLSSKAISLRQALFSLEDALRRHDSLLLAEARAQNERQIALNKAQELLQRLSLQAKLLFPEDPSLLEDSDRFFPKAA